MARGRKTGGGSRAGKPNRATADIKAIAQPYGRDAVRALVKIMKNKAAPEAARVRAASELLDRGYGKARQSIDMNTPTDGAHSLAFFYATNGTQPSDSADTESGAS